MKFKTTILLAILNVVVFFFLLRQESPFDLKTKASEAEASIFERPMSQATSIEVVGSEADQSYVLNLRDGDWSIVNPIEWVANPFAVRRMMSELESDVTTVRFPVSDIESRNQSLADFGLENPEFLIRVGFEEDVSEIAFGAPVEIGDRLYMLSPKKDEILVVEASILRPFLLSVDELRSNTLFSIPEFEIQSLLVEFKAGDDSTRRRFTRQESSWLIDAPFIAPANEARMQSALDRLVNASIQIIGTSVGDQREVSNFNSFARFELIGNRRNTTLLVSQYMINGEVNPDFYRGRIEGTSTIFLIPVDEIDWWRTSPTRLRERRLFAYDISNVSKIELTQSGEPNSGIKILKLENGDWKAYTGEQRNVATDYQIDNGVVEDSLKKLQSLIALEFVTDSPSTNELGEFGLIEPQKTISIEDQSTFKLLIGHMSEDQKRAYAKFDDNSSVFLVAMELVELIGQDPLFYRERRIELFDEDQDLLAFEIEDLESGEVLTVENTRQPLSEEEQQVTFASLKALVQDFAVDRFVKGEFMSEGVSHDDEFLKWRYKLKLALSNRDSPIEILMTKRYSGSGQLAYIAKENVIVNLRKELIDVLHPILFDPKIPEEHEFPDPKILPEESIEETDVEQITTDEPEN